MKQIILSAEDYKILLDKIHENTFGYGMTTLESIIFDNTTEVEDDLKKDVKK
jgi:hypothetical protein